MLAARGDLDGALSAAEDALRRAKQLDMPFVVARTLLAKGQLHRRRKEKRLAKEALALAVARFDELGHRCGPSGREPRSAALGCEPAATS